MIDTSLDTSNFYFLTAVIQGIILATLILSGRNKGLSNICFGILILLLSTSLLHLVLEKSIHAFNSVFPIPMEFTFAYAPLTYFHILYIKDPLRRFNRKDLLHFAPTLFFDLLLFTGFFLFVRYNLDWAYSHVTTIQAISLVIAAIGMLQLGLYTYWIYQQYNDTKAVLREYEKVKDWLKNLMIAWSCLITFLILAVPLGLIFINDLDDNSYLIYIPIGSIISIFIYLLGYLYLLKYSNIIGTYIEKIKKFNFSQEDLNEKKQQILQSLEVDKIFLDQNLTVAKFAGHLGWPINSLSNMINESLHTNFNDLVNQYRIEAFKKLIVEPDSQKFSIAGLGMEVGFSSKASFYRAFKKETGVTPSGFIKSQV